MKTLIKGQFHAQSYTFDHGGHSDPASIGLYIGRGCREHDPTDADLLATVVRETHEEVGLVLSPEGQLVCELMAVQA